MTVKTWTAEQERLLAGRESAVVSAGAGTGKTTFLIEKVRRAVSAGVSPSRILCITYTNKAAGELKNRAREAFEHQQRTAHVGGDAAAAELWRLRLRELESAPICTLHALAGQLLRRHPVQAGLDVDQPVLDSRQAGQLRRRAADRVLANWLGDDADSSAESSADRKAVELRANLRVRYGVRDEGQSAGLLSCLRNAVETVFRVGADPAAVADSIRDNWLEDPQAGSAFAEVLTAALAEYQRLKAGRPDFDDVLRLARDLLRRDAALREHYQRSTALVLLDEAQDASAVQMELVELLAGDPADRSDRSGGDGGLSDRSDGDGGLSDRLIVVGDRKQAIYRFQGADTARFEAVIARLSGLGRAVVALQDNRRCCPGVVRFVNALCAGVPQVSAAPAAPKPKSGRKAKTDADDAGPRGLFAGVLDYRPERDDLIARRPDRQPNAVWHLSLGDSAEGLDAAGRRYQEGQLIARAVAHLTDPAASSVRVFDSNEPSDPGRVPSFGDIAILLARSTNLGLYTQALRERAIPHYAEAGREFFQSPLVADATALVRSLQNPRDGAAAAALLRSPAFGLTDAQWLTLGLSVGGFRLDRLAAQLTAEPTESTAAAAAELDAAPPVALPEHVRRLLAEWLTLHRRKDALSPAELLESWWAATHTGAALAAASGADARQNLANMAKLHRLARDFAVGRGGLSDPVGRTLREFADWLSEEAATAAEPNAPVLGPGEDVVRVMTIHKSKGLEFPIVIVADAGGVADWMPTPSLLFDRELGLVGKIWDPAEGKLTARSGYKRWQEGEKSAVLAEQRRLLYVAATRARDLLILSGDRGKQRRASFLLWVEESGAGAHLRRVVEGDLPAGELPTPRAAWPGSPPEPELAEPALPAEWPDFGSPDATTQAAAAVLSQADPLSWTELDAADELDWAEELVG